MTNNQIKDKKEVLKKTDRYVEGIGRRKVAIARVRIKNSSKNSIIVNNKEADKYFPTAELRAIINKPLTTVVAESKYAITAVIKGGGVHSQAEALAMGLARALVFAEPALKGPIKKAKLLSRDARAKERRKFGLKKARKAPQWSKR